MPTVARVMAALVLLGLAAFCAFGFLATYEPPGSPLLRIMYGLVGALCLTGAGWILVRKERAEPGTAPDQRVM